MVQIDLCAEIPAVHKYSTSPVGVEGKIKTGRLHRVGETQFASCRSARVELEEGYMVRSGDKPGKQRVCMGHMRAVSHPTRVENMAGTEVHYSNRLGNVGCSQHIEILMLLVKVVAESGAL